MHKEKSFSQPESAGDSIFSPQAIEQDIHASEKLQTELLKLNRQAKKLDLKIDTLLKEIQSPSLQDLNHFFTNLKGIRAARYNEFKKLCLEFLKIYDTWTNKYLSLESNLTLMLDLVDDERVHDLYIFKDKLTFPDSQNLSFIMQVADIKDLLAFNQLLAEERKENLETQAHYFSQQLIKKLLVAKHKHVFDPMIAGQDPNVVSVGAHIPNFENPQLATQVAEFDFTTTPNDLYDNIQKAVYAIIMQGKKPKFKISHTKAQNPYSDFSYLQIPQIHILESNNHEVLAINLSDYFVPRLFDIKKYDIANTSIFDLFNKNEMAAKQAEKLQEYKERKIQEQRKRQLVDKQFYQAGLYTQFYNFPGRIMHELNTPNTETVVVNHTPSDSQAIMYKALEHIYALSPDDNRFQEKFSTRKPKLLSQKELSDTIDELSKLTFGVNAKQDAPKAKQDSYFSKSNELNLQLAAIIQLLVDSRQFQD